MDIQAVIFDMDGVLSDSQALHVLAELETCEYIGTPVSKEYMESEAGRPDKMTFQDILIKNGKPLDLLDEMMRYKYTIAMPRALEAKGLPPVPGAVDVVTTLSKKFPCAVASSAQRNFIESTLKKIGIDEYFKHIISVDDIPHGRGKPHPDIFLLAAKKLNVAPEHCLVIEDAQHGVTAAKAAGMLCIGYKNPNSGDQDLSEADFIVENMEEVPKLLQ